jgi:BirA family biotin operon repressor/biotin-[acetyl-CoA-carboxylase] ligase
MPTVQTTARQQTAFDLRRIEQESFVRQVVFRRVLGSTNDFALQLATRQGLRTPLLVITERQTAGRGRGTNRWWSGSGALTFSLLLDAAPLRLQPEEWPRIALACAAAVCDVLEELCPKIPCGIRWPNDVYLAGRKVCGILPEAVTARGPGPDRLVLGIGINVNNSVADAPPDVRAVGVSLADPTGRHHDLTEVLVRLLDCIEERLEQMVRRDPQLPVAWSTRCVLRGHTVELALGQSRVRGYCQGVDHDGALLLQNGRETQQFFGGVVAAVE